MFVWLVNIPRSLCLFILVVGSSLIMLSEGKRPLSLDHLLTENKDGGNWTWPKVELMLKRMVDGFVLPNLNFLRRLSSQLEISSKCQEALFAGIMALRQDASWIIKMADATAKMPAGILDGTVMDFGSFDECLSIRVTSIGTDHETFRGRYCMVGLKHPLLSTIRRSESDRNKYDQLYGSPPPWIDDTMTRGGGFMKEIGIWLGTCIPSSCSQKDLLNIVKSVSHPMGFNASIADCHVDEPRIWKSFEIAAVCVLGCLFAFVTIGTITDILTRVLRQFSGSVLTNVKPIVSPHEHWLLRILKSFSLLGNTERLLRGSGPKGSMLAFFHGIRFLSATWIILGHTYFFVDTWMYLKYRHLIGVTEKFEHKFAAAVLENFTIPVGSFFFISGFLMSYTNWCKIERNGGRLNLLIFFFHKYWRMTPALGLTIVLFIAIPLIGTGPLWNSTFEPEVNRCLNNWWKNLLYINNWWKVEDFCLIHTWYLAALMQFHVIGIFLLLLFFRWPIFTTVASLLILIACSSLTALQVVWHDFPMPAPGYVRDLDITRDYNSEVYIKPYAHFASYLIGMASGFIVIKYRHTKFSMVQKCSGWILATGFGLASVYGIYGPSDVVTVRAAYISLHRISWALAISWLTLTCAFKSAGFVNRLLSWEAFQPLGQLSYLAYLLHPLVILYRNGSLRERVYYSHPELVLIFLGNLMISFFLAFLCYTAVELPCSALEAMMLANRKLGPTKSATSVLPNGHPHDASLNRQPVNVQTVTIRPYYPSEA